MARRPISVITTVYNEAQSIDGFLASVADQTRQADEIVIVDAGSTDGTLERLTAAAESDPRLRIIVEPGNRSHGRNTAIENATHEIVACTDGGCTLDPEWLEHLATPFDAGADWVAGFYRVEAPTALDRCIGLTIVFVVEEVDPDLFLPSARSMAMTKSAWEQAGRFPEEAEFGEDTLFNEMMLTAGFRPVFASRATVAWHPPSGFGGLARTAYQWGRGDGAAGLRGPYYKATLVAYAGTAALAALLAFTKPRLLPLSLLPIAGPMWRSIRYKLRHEASTAKYMYLPAANLTATISNLTGFLVGRYLGEQPMTASRRNA
jgi:cellulose synthase/poly-beta-1,6-N-acetylglucosamine synthase-like glycosyltransferase